MKDKAQDWGKEIDVILDIWANPDDREKLRKLLKSSVSSLLATQLEEVRKKIGDYIEKNRHKVERIDRYVLDDLLSNLQDNNK